MTASQKNSERLSLPEQLHYSQDHVWLDDSSSPAVLGVTEYAAEQLGDLVFLDLPETGAHVEAGDEIVELESAKAVEPLVCPVAGTIAYVNRAAADDPGVINSDPYGEGWILKLELDDDQPDLMSADEYGKLIDLAQ
ncbi:glycine cleavage system H protein [Bifidobacterium actinocoloniiforme DSM 22766]|uniref:Glycine cleavage system H protein n=1 Tax=Bifidobacterium actinocoloniiforme DSM 22766 TaxID=1437605 RepID=A0A086YZD6_9BIFI|nr:glycine cleavage system protein GcvH [Bifidobacterium actinocoloniiforme]AKV54977.1 glycine cleavage system protein H [Bifidobacterium actinocoloniiforme DSM 22766]KFI39636.1 glycine cleavage system H protein [Bifidobacterium actinocoloniiforme DSM 22766]